MLLGNGLLTNTGETHKQMRRVMNPAFSLVNLTARMCTSPSSAGRISQSSTEIDAYYEPIEGYARVPAALAYTHTDHNRFIEILNGLIQTQPDADTASTTVLMYEWCMFQFLYAVNGETDGAVVSKVTLDIICETAFGYRTDSLHDPDNALAKAYGNIADLQSGCIRHPPVVSRLTLGYVGPNIAGLIFFVCLPGGFRLLASDWASEHHSWFRAIPLLGVQLIRYQLSYCRLTLDAYYSPTFDPSRVDTDRSKHIPADAR